MSIVKKLLGEAEVGETMSAGDLIAFLQQFPAETPVFYGHPSHDHWRTELAGAIKGGEQQRVKYSDYHQTNQIDAEPRDDDSDDDRVVPAGTVLVLSSRRR